MNRWLGIALVCTLLVGPLAVREAAAGAPTEQLRTQVDRVLKLLDDSTLKAPDKARDRRTAVRKVADEIFDFGETAKRSLGRHWAARTPEEREEFVKLFGDLLERSYISKIELYGGEKIQYVADKVDGETAVVQSKLLTKGGGEVPIEYRMHKRSEKWLVYDVLRARKRKSRDARRASAGSSTTWSSRASASWRTTARSSTRSSRPRRTRTS